MRIVENQGRNGIGADHLRLNGGVGYQVGAEGEQVVGKKGDGRQQQRRAADQHVHGGEFSGERIAKGDQLFHRRSYFLISVATFKS